MFRALVSYGFLAGLVLATIGQLVRDRALPLMLAMFVPLAPFALVAWLWDILMLGHALPRRWLLSAVAISCALLGCAGLWRPALPADQGALETPVRIVHWNTMWGGRSSKAFRAIIDRLDSEHADIVCLSEAPETVRLEKSWKKRHPDASIAAATNNGHGSYWYNLAVVSRYPTRLRDEHKLARGRVALFEVEHPARTLRIMMVDLLSSPLSPRSPSIEQAAALIDARSQAGEPIDIVVGDFNTPGSFLGFDTLENTAGGYRKAALWSGEWRATWPSFSPIPLFDIDHLWVSKRLQIHRASFFTTLATDHRGQRAELSLSH